MMRGMFSAISGLKNHQVMLDVTANDIANVNTIGYKSARTTFKDSLTQLQRGASGRQRRQRRHERGAGRPRRRPRLDRQPDDRRRAAVDGQPARRRDPGRGLLPGRARALPAGDAGRRHRAVHARRQLHHQHGRLPAHAGGLLRRRPRRRRRGGDRPAACRSRPAARTSRSARTARSPTSRPAAAPARPWATSSLATFQNAAGLERALRQPLDRLGELGRRAGRHARQRRQGPDLGGHDRDVQRGPRPDVHEHDHRAARLPGQLARHLDRRTRCCRTWSTSSASDVADRPPRAAVARRRLRSSKGPRRRALRV